MNFVTTNKTRRCPIAMNMDLESAKQANEQIADLSKDKNTPEIVLAQLHLSLETALGGVARPARGFLPDTVKPATLRAQGAKGWQYEADQYRSHARQLLAITDPVKRRAFVAQRGLEYQPILNNRHEKRAWLRIVEGL